MKKQQYKTYDLTDPVTGVEISVDWDGSESPTQDDVTQIFENYYTQNPVANEIESNRSYIEQYVEPKLPKESIINIEKIREFT